MCEGGIHEGRDFLTHLTREENDVRSLMNFPLETENKKLLEIFQNVFEEKEKSKKKRFQMYL